MYILEPYHRSKNSIAKRRPGHLIFKNLIFNNLYNQTYLKIQPCKINQTTNQFLPHLLLSVVTFLYLRPIYSISWLLGSAETHTSTLSSGSCGRKGKYH